jgi:hypothetical protein
MAEEVRRRICPDGANAVGLGECRYKRGYYENNKTNLFLKHDDSLFLPQIDPRIMLKNNIQYNNI